MYISYYSVLIGSFMILFVGYLLVNVYEMFNNPMEKKMQELSGKDTALMDELNELEEQIKTRKRQKKTKEDTIQEEVQMRIDDIKREIRTELLETITNTDNTVDLTREEVLLMISEGLNTMTEELSLTTENLKVPSGVIMAYDSDVIPTGWEICDGEKAMINGSSIDKPNLQGRMIIGSGPENAMDDGIDLILGQSTYTNKNGRTISGRLEHQLTIDEMPNHNHSRIIGAKASGRNLQGWGANGYSNHTSYTGATGGDSPHNNMPPFLVLNWIIKVDDPEPE